MKIEQKIQILCIKWFRMQYPHLAKLLFAVPNGGSRHKLEAANMKKEGVLAGVPDILFVYKTKVYAIEMKAPKGRLSQSQKDLHPVWNDHLALDVFICYSLDDFMQAIEKIIKYATIH
jgi:hypothetical protein